MQNKKPEWVNEVHNLEGIILGALIGSSLADFKLDPSSIFDLFIGLILIFSVLASSICAHFMFYKYESLKMRAIICFGVFSAFIVYFVDAAIFYIYDLDLLKNHIGIEKNDLYVILTSIFIWVITSWVMRWLVTRSSIHLDVDQGSQQAHVMFDQVKVMTERLDRLHSEQQAEVDRLRTELEQARRPWWRRWFG
jgi:hypothetical protein